MRRLLNCDTYPLLSFDGAKHRAAFSGREADKVKAASFGLDGMYAGGCILLEYQMAGDGKYFEQGGFGNFNMEFRKRRIRVNRQGERLQVLYRRGVGSGLNRYFANRRKSTILGAYGNRGFTHSQSLHHARFAHARHFRIGRSPCAGFVRGVFGHHGGRQDKRVAYLQGIGLFVEAYARYGYRRIGSNLDRYFANRRKACLLYT